MLTGDNSDTHPDFSSNVPVPRSSRVRGVLTRGAWILSTALNSLSSLKHSHTCESDVLVVVFVFAFVYLGVKLIWRCCLELQDPWSSFGRSSPKSGVTLKTCASRLSDCRNGDRLNSGKLNLKKIKDWCFEKISYFLSCNLIFS